MGIGAATGFSPGGFWGLSGAMPTDQALDTNGQGSAIVRTGLQGCSPSSVRSSYEYRSGTHKND
ncbi:LOW QUALITY PROTEIN: hypothetical protein O9K51_00296 [Purpureocillium lavendulum]|uniref:Uncharacterized protein n=1 Tax=Purpureocillium lavendulum TaxID=1247861 RepID=A0AB34G2B9_9HYPO|nr:LOW QUALITY PROTEIN: hypothetical protein O9K51_00296 [Purpureocillium lavendulum]